MAFLAWFGLGLTFKVEHLITFSDGASAFKPLSYVLYSDPKTYSSDHITHLKFQYLLKSNVSCLWFFSGINVSLPIYNQDKEAGKGAACVDG